MQIFRVQMNRGRGFAYFWFYSYTQIGMATARHLSAPPITEAVFDLRVEHVTAPTQEQILSLHSRLKDIYPICEPRRQFEGKFDVNIGKDGAKVQSNTSDRFLGYRFFNPERNQVASFKTNGMTLSRLKPYSGWDTLMPEFRRLWEIYRTSTTPKSIKRIAYRTINAIAIAEKNFDLDDYFECSPKIPRELPQKLDNFLVRLVIPFEAEGLRAILTHTIAPTAPPAIPKIIFDVDVFGTVTMDTADNRLWEVFETIHGVKNNIFFSSLKDRAVELFN